MSKLPYIKFFAGDYLADTWILSTLEHGAYFLLLLNYWVKGGPLPDDDKELAKMTRLSVKKWKKVSEKVKPFFIEKDGFLIHGRVEEELKKACAKSEQTQKAGRASAAARRTGVRRT